jgi:hypothetical protein
MVLVARVDRRILFTPANLGRKRWDVGSWISTRKSAFIHLRRLAGAKTAREGRVRLAGSEEVCWVYTKRDQESRNGNSDN